MNRARVIAFTLLLTACASVSNMALESAYIDQQISSGKVKQDIKHFELSSTHDQIINHAENQFNEFRHKWKGVIDDPELFLSSTQELLDDYIVLRNRYSDVDAVVRANWDKYDKLTQMQLLNYQNHAKRLDDAVTSFIAAKNKQKAAVNAIEYVSTVASIILNIKR